MLERFVSVTRATIKGTILISIIQGSLAGVGFYFAGIDGAAFGRGHDHPLGRAGNWRYPGLGADGHLSLRIGAALGSNSAGHLVCGRGRNRRQRPASILCRQGRRDSGPSYSYWYP